ncbi:hypothetical protein A2U01_0116619, partial [Trifolium medium]|nr:hypothetical protein [Trifolium medium]
MILSRFGKVSANCAPCRKDCASRQQVLRRFGIPSVICASRRKDGALRQAVRII